MSIEIGARTQRQQERVEHIDVHEVNQKLQAEWVLKHYGVWGNMKVRGDSIRGLSPLRQETKASFSVKWNSRRGIWMWNDLGGRPILDGRPAPGNMVGLVWAMEGGEFRSALEKAVEICREYDPSFGLEQSAVDGAVSRGAGRTKREVEEVVIPPNEPFRKELRGLKYKHEYLEKHGITEATARIFKVGYYGGPGTMRRRIAFPVFNTEQEVVFYTGRATRENQEPVWRIPGEVKKQLELFGVDKIVHDSQVIPYVAEHGVTFVEGPHDVMKLHQEGFFGGLGCLGDHLSEYQMFLAMAHNPSKKVALFFDNDPGGIQGRRTASKMLIHEAFVRLIDYRRVPIGELIETPTDPRHFTGQELETLFSRQLGTPIYDGIYNVEMVYHDPIVQQLAAQSGIILVDSPEAVGFLINVGFPNVLSLGEGRVYWEQVMALLTKELNPSGKVTLFGAKGEQGAAWARNVARYLMFDGYVRLVDYELIPTGAKRSSPFLPQHLTREELMILLMQDPV